MYVVPAAGEYDVLMALVSTPSPLSITITESPLSVHDQTVRKPHISQGIHLTDLQLTSFDTSNKVVTEDSISDPLL
jgi:hypothetical protein